MTTPRPQERFEQGRHPEGHLNPIQLDEDRLVYVREVGRDPVSGEQEVRDVPLEELTEHQIEVLKRYRQMRRAADTPEAQEEMKKWNRFTGNADPLSFGFWLKDSYLKGTSDQEKAEFAETISVFCEGDKMPRSMGMGYLDTQSELYYWFDERVVWDCHDPNFHFQGTWRDPWPKDYPDYPELTFEQKKMWHPRIAQVPRDYDHPEVRALATQEEKDALIQEGLNFCKTQYVAITKFRIERGNAEDWMNKVEPNFLLFQKPVSSAENCSPNVLYEMIANMIVVEKEYSVQGDAGSEKLAKLRVRRQQLKKLMKAVDRLKRGQGESGDQQILNFSVPTPGGGSITVHFDKRFWYKEYEVQTAPKGAIQTVASKWREFHPVGEVLFREWPRTNLASLPGTRRGQGRLQFLIGMETMGEGEFKGQVTPDSVKYGLLSHCYNLNELFTDAIMGKVNPETHDLVLIESRLNRYRLLHGMIPVMIRPITVAAALSNRESLFEVMAKAISDGEFNWDPHSTDHDWPPFSFKRSKAPEGEKKKGRPEGGPGTPEPPEEPQQPAPGPTPTVPAGDVGAHEREMRALDIVAAQMQRMTDGLIQALGGKKGGKGKGLTPEEEERRRVEKEQRKSPPPGSGITQRRWEGLPQSEKKYLWRLYRNFRGMVRRMAEEKGYVDEENKERWDPSLNDLFED